jgi:hypothetical protein
MDDYKQRLRSETIQTRERLEKLTKFVDAWEGETADIQLEATRYLLLNQQLEVMKQLLSILEDRCTLEDIVL